MANDLPELAKADERQLIEATFRNGSITAIGVVVGFSLGFLSRWSALPAEWTPSDLISITLITLGLALQLKRYNRSIWTFLIGLTLVGTGIILAIFADPLGFRGIVLQG
jgi:uncharacterized membrane protein YccC